MDRSECRTLPIGQPQIIYTKVLGSSGSLAPLARIIHDDCYCNRPYAAATSLRAEFRHASGGLTCLCRARQTGRLAGQQTVKICPLFSRLHAPASQRDSRISQ